MTVRVFGVRVDDVTTDESLHAVETWVIDRTPRQIATVNPEYLMAARGNAAFAALLNQTDLNVPDGTWLVRAARWSGSPLREVVRGVDFVEQLAARAAKQGWRVFLLGAADGVAEAAGAALQQRHPGLIVAGSYAGRADESGDAAARSAIQTAGRVDVLFVAYGQVKQDFWIARNSASLGVPVSIGVGGTFDYLAGVVPRAPRFMINAGFEWLYRLVQQPWRWRRMLEVVRFLLIVAAGKLTRRPVIVSG